MKESVVLELTAKEWSENLSNMEKGAACTDEILTCKRIGANF